MVKKGQRGMRKDRRKETNHTEEMGEPLKANYGTTPVIDSMQTFGIVFSIVYSVMIFGSSAFYSLERMPLFIRVISLVNPVTYSVNLVRQVLLLDQGMICTDFAVLLVMTFGLLWGAVRAMNRMIDTI